MATDGSLNSAESRRPRFFYGYVVVFAAFFIMALGYGAFYSFGVFFEPVITEFGWSRAVTSGAYSLAMILHSAVAVGTGSLNDRFGSRIVVTVSGFFFGIGYILMSQLDGIWQLYLFYGVMVGLGMSGLFVPLLSTVAKWFTRRRGLMTGIVVSGIGAGTMILPPIARLLISTYEWRVSYIIVGIIALVAIMGLAQFLKRDPAQMGLTPYGESEVKVETSDLQDSGFSLQEALRTRQLWILFVIYLGLIFCVQSMMVHIVIHTTGLGMAVISAAAVPAIIGGVSVAGRITAGSVADRIGNKPSMVIALILLSGGLLWLVVARDLWMLYLFAAVFGFGYGGLVAVESTIPAELFGLGSHGVILGVIFLGAGIGGAAGPVLVGHIFDITNSYQLGFLTCAAIAIVCLVLGLLLKPISKREIDYPEGSN